MLPHAWFCNSPCALQEQIRAACGTAETLDLPAAGIAGSSHMMMMDTNRDEIAERIQARIAARGLMR
jgi:hypothetical protein